MTDNEIIKVLECCKSVDIDGCKDCPIRGENCINIILTNSLDLIKRQKAEIQRLKAMVDYAEEYLHPLPFKNDFNEEIAETKSKAIKEFAERLCEGRVSNDPVVISAKCLVKEMTEGEK